ncbi:AraC family transcriptional regulator [Pasteurellaceae bacterium LIM206]|nr:AraC family transcriptional regulator [Pasteurellaceae bacterium LIM206]
MWQHYIKENKNSIFEHNHQPQLCYITNTQGMQEYLPRMLHKHDEHLEIVFVAQGKGKHIIDGTKYDTKAGDVLIFNQGVIHDEMAQLNSDMVTYCCGIRNLKIKGMEPNCLFDISAPAVISSGEHKETINKILEMMFFYVDKDLPNAHEFANYLLLSLLTIIVSLPKQWIRPVFYKKRTLVDQVKDYLEQNYTEPLTLSKIATRFKVSTSYLSHLFKKETKFSPIQYLNRRRIGEAQSLLMTTNQTITQISIAVGYNDPNYFTAAFSKITGISPKSYRELWIGQQLEFPKK